MQEMQATARTLTQHRKAKGLTQKALAAAVGRSVGVVNLWEAGKCEPSAPLIPKLSEVLGVEPLDLMDIIAATRAARIIPHA